jgi:hypothetical protein
MEELQMELDIDVKQLNEEQINMLINLAVEAKIRERLNGKNVNLEQKTTVRHYRKRHQRGEDFTMEDIQQIWNMYKKGDSIRKIGRVMRRTYYSINTIIWAIKNKTRGRSQILSEFIDTLEEDNTPKHSRRYKRLTNTEKATIIKEIKAGSTLDKVANLLHRSKTTIYNIYNLHKKGKITLESLGE